MPDTTYALAIEHAKDIGNRRMRDAGSSCWSVEDLAHAIEYFKKQVPHITCWGVHRTRGREFDNTAETGVEMLVGQFWYLKDRGKACTA